MGTEVPASRGRRTSVPVIVILALLFLGAPPLKASEEDGWDLDIEFSDGFVAAMSALFIAEMALDATSLVFAIGNMAYASSNKRPSSTWINGGYVCGGLNIVEGIVVLAIGAPQRENEFALGFGIAHLVVGVASISLALWSSSKPESDEPLISVSPIVLSDRDGSPTVGIGLQVMNW